MVRVTVKDVAREAGVSVATVSRVINQNGRFSADTERRVRQAIERLGYQPNQLARGLRQQRADLVGVVVPNISNEFFSRLIMTVQQRLFDAGLSIMIFNTNHSLDMERQCYASLAAQRVCGVISANALEDVRAAMRHDVPVVYIDRPAELAPHVSVVMSDNVAGGRLAARELVRSGCTRPLLVSATAHFPITEVRTKSFADTLAELGVCLAEDHVLTPPATDFAGGHAAAEEALARGLDFDGVFCETDRLAIGFMNELGEKGVRVPADVTVVGFDDVLLARFGRPPLTTVRQSPERIGELAADTLLQMVRGELAEGRRELVPVELVRRESTMRGGVVADS
jgi:LacI family transcriptional regulator